MLDVDFLGSLLGSDGGCCHIVITAGDPVQ